MSKTLFGFEGVETDAPPPAVDEPRGAASSPIIAKTVFGRDMHLPAAALQAAAASANAPLRKTPAPTRTSGVAAARPRAITPRALRNSDLTASRGMGRKTSPPAKARFLGRRDSDGNIVALTQTDLTLPRPAWMRPVFTIVLAAATSFLVVAAVLWLWGPRRTAMRPATPAAATERAAPAATAAAPPPAPAPAAVVDPLPLPPPPAPTTVSPRARRTRPRASKAPASSQRHFDPDAPLPPTFF